MHTLLLLKEMTVYNRFKLINLNSYVSSVTSLSSYDLCTCDIIMYMNLHPCSNTIDFKLVFKIFYNRMHL